MKIENTNYAATIQCARQHFSYCAAAHPRSLEGTLLRMLLMLFMTENFRVH